MEGLKYLNAEKRVSETAVGCSQVSTNEIGL